MATGRVYGHDAVNGIHRLKLTALNSRGHLLLPDAAFHSARKGAEMSAEAKWTFMVYMAGDNNLAAAGEADLAEMRRYLDGPEKFIGAKKYSWGVHAISSGGPGLKQDFGRDEANLTVAGK
jgi:hypothetical protein